mmetsp:Transcript_36304/g.80800  ORF Transcript_36304/g.80800 Transcript_36304/m.80800 type:complete len:300 (-) Transcript_36304:3-902(-)
MAATCGVPRSVTRVVSVARKVMNPGFSAVRVGAEQFPKMDPFLACDWFLMSKPTFPPHPHAGFSAVTMLLEDSENNFTNRDSHGDFSIIRPGDTHWTCAGSGIVHEEIPEKVGVPGHGLQLFVNLAPEHKTVPAKISKLQAKDTPIHTTPGGGRVRVIAGQTDEGRVASPINEDLFTKVTLLDVTLPPGATFSHEVPAGYNAMAIVLKGSVAFGNSTPAAQGSVVNKEQVVEFGDDGSTIEAVGLEGEGGPAQFVVLSGKPINAPVVWQGPFCGNSQKQVGTPVSWSVSGRLAGGDSTD